MTDNITNANPAFLPTLRPERNERRLALIAVAVSTLIFIAIAPFAKVPLAKVPAFIPIYESALVINDLITAVLLFGQFIILRSRALLVLAGGYLFTAFMAAAHALTFPGLFTQTGLLGAGPQSTAWLYMFWHGGFPISVIAYAIFKDGWRHERPHRAILICTTLALAITAAFTVLATTGQDLLPKIMQGNHYTPAMIVVVSGTWILNMLALAALWKRRSRSVLDLWLMVVMCGWLFDIALSAILNAGRFDLGFYAGRIYGLLAASFVLMILLLENGKLYAQLVDTHMRERRKTNELRELSAQLEKANRLKSEFLANMSHELRTPLNAIIGFSEIMKDGVVGEQSPEQHEYTTEIFNSGQHLLSLINDILDLSKIEAGKMTLDLAPLDVEPILRSSLSIVREKAQSQGLELELVINDALPPTLADIRKTKQIVYNLLSNAVKFTPEGGRVTLRARKVRRDDMGNLMPSAETMVNPPLPPGNATEFLEIAVLDTGRGIAPDDAPRLFQTFSQIDASLSRETEGTGLGLILVLKLAQLHGGTVALASTPGKGSCVTAWLPWRETQAANSDSSQAPVSPVNQASGK